MKDKKDKKDFFEGLSRNQKIVFSLLLIIAVVFIALTVIFAIKYENYKKDVTSSANEGTFVLLIDDDGNRTPDYEYTFHGNYKGVTLEKFLKQDVTTDDLTFYFTYSPMGGFLDTITIKGKPYPRTNSKFWEIDSSTSSHGKNQPNGMTDVGASSLILDNINVYTFSYQAIN